MHDFSLLFSINDGTALFPDSDPQYPNEITQNSKVQPDWKTAGRGEEVGYVLKSKCSVKMISCKVFVTKQVYMPTTLESCTREVLGSSLVQDTSHHGSSCGFPQYLHENAGIMP
jgi:hypothetical protein